MKEKNSVSVIETDEPWEFQTEGGNQEPNSVGILDRLHSVDSAMQKLADREKDLQDFMSGSSKDMSLTWISPDQDADRRGGGFFVKHKDISVDAMPVAHTAIRSACNMMGTKWGFYEQFPDSARKFVNDFRSFTDHRGQGVVLRTGTSQDGINRMVESFVPSDFDRTSDAQILGAMLQRIRSDYPNAVRGVQILSDGERGVLDYRVLFGSTLMREDSRDPTKAVLPMLSFTSSEIGLCDSQVALGLYRIYCRNGMMRKDWEGGIAKWNRRNRPNNFVAKIGEVIGNVGHFAAGVSETLTPRMNEPLAVHALELLGSLSARGLIGRKHFEAAERSVGHSPAATEYDFLNLLTDSAKQLNPLTARKEAESTALRLAMQPRGFRGIYEDGFNKDFAKNQAKVLIAG